MNLDVCMNGVCVNVCTSCCCVAVFMYACVYVGEYACTYVRACMNAYKLGSRVEACAYGRCVCMHACMNVCVDHEA